MIARAGGLVAVIGSPVRHSLSPVMHNAAFADVGSDWSFTQFELREGGMSAALAAMPVLGIGGYAVTMPHKEAAARQVDAVDASARALDSVNTIVLRDDGTTLGASTDGVGFVDWLVASGHDVAGWRIVMLGAGAAARSIIHALGLRGAGDIAVVNRTVALAERAASLADCAHVGTVDAIAESRLIVNATSVGMGTDELPLDPALIGPDHVVADIVYHPLDTGLLRAARAAGAETIDGLGMLVHQAVLQQELWTGRRADPALMRLAAERELASRARPAASAADHQSGSAAEPHG